MAILWCYVCVCERERDRERDKNSSSLLEFQKQNYTDGHLRLELIYNETILKGSLKSFWWANFFEGKGSISRNSGVAGANIHPLDPAVSLH